MRFWVPSRKYYQKRYAVHMAALKALVGVKMKFLPSPSAAAVIADSGRQVSAAALTYP